MPNSFTGSSLTRENGGITLLVEGVSVQYLQDLRFVAATTFNDEVTLHFRDPKRNRTKIQLEAKAADKDTWFEMLSEKKLILKDYSDKCIETQSANDVFGLAESVIKTIRHLNILDGTAQTKEQQQNELREDLKLSRMKRRAGFLK